MIPGSVTASGTEFTASAIRTIPSWSDGHGVRRDRALPSGNSRPSPAFENNSDLIVCFFMCSNFYIVTLRDLDNAKNRDSELL